MNKKYILLVVPVIAILIGITGFNIARYNASKPVSSSITLAQPIIELTSNIAEQNITTEQSEYDMGTFVVKNYNSSNKINDTAQKYYVEFIYTNLDKSKMTITLTRNGIVVPITNNEKTAEFDLKTGSKQDDTFSLKIKYNEIVHGADLQGNIAIKLHSYQVQPN